MKQGTHSRLTREGESETVTPKGQGCMVVVRVSSSECIHLDEHNPSFNGNLNLNTTGTNFEALLEDIDRESSHDGKESDPIVMKIIKEIKKDDTKMDDSDSAVLTEKSMSKCLKLEAN